MNGMMRYLRLWTAFATFGLLRELSFRSNFFIKIFVEVLWLGVLLLFYQTIFAKTASIATWSEPEYLFFIGVYYTLSGAVESFFLGNCSEFAELVRSGDLDTYLLKPIDEQFLITCRDVDWSSFSNILMGGGVMAVALHRLDWTFEPLRASLFVFLFVCGLAIAYSLLVILTSLSVWMLRNQSLYELWWLFTSVMRYPREIFHGTFAGPVGLFFTVVVPILLVVNVPAHTLIRVFEPWTAAFTALVAVGLLFISRRFFKYALQRYRSASS